MNGRSRLTSMIDILLIDSDAQRSLFTRRYQIHDDLGSP